MSVIVSEVYDALVEAGVTVEKARAAAAAIPVADRFVTREEFTEQTGMLNQGLSEVVFEVQQVRQEVGDLKRELGGVKQDISGLENHVARLDNDIGRLDNDIGRLGNDIGRLDKDISGLDKRLAVLNLAVFSFGPAIIALLAKLVFFP
ncbi:MAG: hypothetical protein OXF11_04040 [Deltaproteobacteria bacterium]|nr:hypothetical protein [Deltaproteobacteria bacterium]